VVCKTEWGSWAQTIDDVVIEIDVPKGTKSREIKCNITPKSLTVSVQGNEIIKVIFNAATLCVPMEVQCKDCSPLLDSPSSDGRNRLIVLCVCCVRFIISLLSN